MSAARITGIEIDDDCVVLGEIAIISYMDSEGEKWACALGGGDMVQSHIVGLLEMAKYGFLAA